ncbi:MAG: YgjP-like metallopeptidase domain-containing protein [bacterium]
MIEKGTVSFGRKNINFFVKRSKKRKTVSVFVDPIEGVFLRAPFNLSIGFLSKLVHSKAVWIIDKQRHINEIREHLPKREFITGETFMYLGRQLRLKILESKNKPTITVKGGRFLVIIHGWSKKLEIYWLVGIKNTRK